MDSGVRGCDDVYTMYFDIIQRKYDVGEIDHERYSFLIDKIVEWNNLASIGKEDEQMSKKVIARFYATYGKMEGDELVDGFIGDDSEEFRKELLDNISYDYAYDSEEEFINGDINSFAYASYGGDWDAPTGGYIVIRTKQELIDAIKKRAAEEIKEIEKSFERADD